MLIPLILLCSWACTDSPGVKTGLDVVVAEGFKIFQGKKIGLITNHTAVDRRGRHIADLFDEAEGVQLKALFGPEHGIRGAAEGGESIAAQVDPKTSVPIYSLYGNTYKPTQEMLGGLDALVFDMQDVGTRFYTYISTMAIAMEAAAEHDLEFYVLDRPNPIGGRVEGPMLERAHRSFVGIHPLALRHGMTLGELARMFVGEGWVWHSSLDTAMTPKQKKVWNKLHVVTLQNWSHKQFFHKTGLPWISPSPNMTNVNTALLYPGMGLLEATNFSEGRGTNQPFEVIGAPWLESAKLIALLRDRVEGLSMQATTFVPQDLPGKAMNPKFEGLLCQGVQLQITSAEKFESVKFGATLLWALHELHPDKFTISEARMARMFGNSALPAMLTTGLDALWQHLESEGKQFQQLRQKYLLYEE
ncbi:DUF1343 domain-containing protein [candidate division KSB1 bacterium]|nr:DUF1343 domain-containing protein [candidate division KSB1 bacterium]